MYPAHLFLDDKFYFLVYRIFPKRWTDSPSWWELFRSHIEHGRTEKRECVTSWRKYLETLNVVSDWFDFCAYLGRGYYLRTFGTGFIFFEPMKMMCVHNRKTTLSMTSKSFSRTFERYCCHFSLKIDLVLVKIIKCIGYLHMML